MCLRVGPICSPALSLGRNDSVEQSDALAFGLNLSGCNPAQTTDDRSPNGDWLLCCQTVLPLPKGERAWVRGNGAYQAAIAQGHKAEKLRPKEQLVHTNLSLFYMKAGDKKTAEHHGLQARIASWRDDKTPPGEKSAQDPELEMAKPASPKLPEK